MTTKHIRFPDDIQDYQPKCLPPLSAINRLPDEQFANYVRRGCQPETTDALWLLSLVRELEARIERLEAREGLS